MPTAMLAATLFLFASPARSEPGGLEILPLAEVNADTSYFGPHWLVLDHDRILVWDYDGKARLRTADGGWNPELRLPYRDVMTVIADRNGFLAAGFLPFPVELQAISRFDPEGREIRRWYPPQFISHLTVTRKERYAATRKGLIPLLEDGGCGPLQPFPLKLSRGHMGGALLLDGENRVLCRGSDLSLAHRAFARCEQLRPMGWSIARDAAMQPPAACGPWILFREGDRLERLTVHSSRTGAMMGSRTFGLMPAIACADSQTLALGGNTLELAYLPSLRPMWKKRLRRGRIRDLMVLGDSIAFTLMETPALYLLARKPR